MARANRLAACFVVGAVLGTLLDGIHLYGDVESYRDPVLGRWAWFVPLEFGLAGLAAGVAVPVIERRFGPPAPPRFGITRRLGETVVFTAAYVATALFDGDGAPWLAAGLLALLALRLVVAPVRGDWAYAAAAAALGAAAEIAILQTRAFDYAHPDLAGIPVWLPALWANGGLLIRRLFVPLAYGADESRSDTSPPSTPTYAVPSGPSVTGA
jgi:Protein of unknown function (DUF2878)